MQNNNLVSLVNFGNGKRYQDALLMLSKNQWRAGHDDILDSLRLATNTATQVLNVARCSVWVYDNDKTSINCIDLFDSTKNKHESGLSLKSADYPDYFEALSHERIISADSARTNKYTCQFTDSYLIPLGITSMLDAPIWLAGRAVGVLCCEHIGAPRKWSVVEENFAASVADFVSISFELAEHKKTTLELRKHQDELESLVNKRTRELAEKNADLEAFNYSVSHDLKTPLNQFFGYMQLLERACADKIEDQWYQCIRKAITSASDMNAMIDAMIKLSQVSSHELSFAETDLSCLMRDIATPLIESEKVNLQIDDVPTCSCDIELMRIALTNLLENAIKYSSSKDISIIEFGAMLKNDETIYYLKDNGCGFDMKDSEKLFDAFTRLGNSTRFNGSGIGLSTVERVIRKHNGKLWAEGEVDNGSVFYFSLG